MPSDWVIVRKIKDRLEMVYLVKRQVHGIRQTGYFKYETQKSLKKLGRSLANEYITTQLAKRVHLPVADVELATIGGKTGIVSRALSGRRLMAWNDMGKAKHSCIGQHMIQPNRLLKLFIFDVWTCNIDRHGQNIIVYPKNGKYDFYMIDHSLTLLSALKWTNRRWNAPYWDHRAAVIDPNYLPGLPKYLKQQSTLLPYIQKIQQLPDSDVKSIVQAVPRELLSSAEKQIVINMLIYRKHRLPSIVPRWLKEYRKKTRLTPWVSP